MEGLRSSKRRLAAALTSSVALAAASWPSSVAAQPAARPEGLIALYQYGQCAKPGECGLLRPKAADNSAISGLMIRLKWKDVQTGPRASDFNWEMTDNVFRQAGTNKFVVLSFVPGIETPDWALDRIPEGGKEKFCIPYGLKTEVGTETTFIHVVSAASVEQTFELICAPGKDISSETDVGPAAAIIRNRGFLAYLSDTACRKSSHSFRYVSFQGRGSVVSVPTSVLRP